MTLGFLAAADLVLAARGCGAPPHLTTNHCENGVRALGVGGFPSILTSAGSQSVGAWSPPSFARFGCDDIESGVGKYPDETVFRSNAKRGRNGQWHAGSNDFCPACC